MNFKLKRLALLEESRNNPECIIRPSRPHQNSPYDRISIEFPGGLTRHIDIYHLPLSRLENDSLILYQKLGKRLGDLITTRYHSQGPLAQMEDWESHAFSNFPESYDMEQFEELEWNIDRENALYWEVRELRSQIVEEVIDRKIEGIELQHDEYQSFKEQYDLLEEEVHSYITRILGSRSSS